MNLISFWKIIDIAKEESVNCCEKAINSLKAQLTELDIPEIIMWRNIFDEYHDLSCKNKLWAVAHILNNGCRSDTFEYFRAWLILQGHDIYMKALENPESLINAPRKRYIYMEYEYILYVPEDAYFAVRNEINFDEYYKELKKYPISEDMKQQIEESISYDNEIDNNWETKEDLKKLIPALYSKYINK